MVRISLLGKPIMKVVGIQGYFLSQTTRCNIITGFPAEKKNEM